MYLITKWFGTFLCDEKGIHKEILFPKDEIEIAKRLQAIEKKMILAEEKKITKGIKEIIVNEKRLQPIGEYLPSDPLFKKLTINPETFGFSQELLHIISVSMTENKVADRFKSEDLQIIQMVNALDDLIHISNLLSERFERWSMIPTPDEKIQPLKNTITTVHTEMEHLEEQIDHDMQHVAPNIRSLVGPLIGARLIAIAGGLQRLALLPASTVQILGAEKALFRFKKEGGKPPKHGVIFQHQLIYRAPREQRGKIARIFALKIALAAKADMFTKRNMADELQKALDKQIQTIKNQH